MNDLESMDEVIECARVQLEPGATDRMRVKRALVAKLAGLATVGTSTVTQGAVASAASGGLSATHTIVGLIKVFMSSVVVTATGATALLVAGEALVPSSSDMHVATPPLVAPAAPPTVPRSLSRVAQPEPRVGSTPVAHSTPAKSHAPAKSQAPLPASAPGPEPQTRGLGSRAEVDPLNAELALLQRARALTAAGRAREARALLNELDQKHPGGVLIEERAALAAILSCQERTGAARTHEAEAYLTRYPNSVYVSRIRQACAPRAAAPLIDASGLGH